jgi:polysaccharide biosynthesis/export protein
MKQLLRTVCALLYASAYCAAQANNATQKIPPASAVPSPAPTTGQTGTAKPVTKPPASTTPVTIIPGDAASQDNKPVPAGNSQGTPPAGNASDLNAIKPGCDVDKPPAPETSSVKAYVIGSLDVLEIKVWKDANLSGYFDVGPDGMISLPLVGQIKADGMTQADLTRTIRNRLAGTVFECAPEVNVQVLKVNSKRYSMYGGIMKTGEFPLQTDITVMDAFANSGGFKEFAKQNKIYILRKDASGVYQKIPFNYKDVSRGRHTEQDIKLQNGDKIFVPE